MALGDNRQRKVVNGQTYWFNPNTKQYFKSKTSTNPVPKPGVGSPGGPGGPSTVAGGPGPVGQPRDATGGATTIGGGGTKDGVDTGFGDPDHDFSGGTNEEGEWVENGAVNRPPKPSAEPPAGYEWYWDESHKRWDYRLVEGTATPETAEQTAAKASLLAQMQTFLADYGLDTPGMLDFIKTAISSGWDATRIKLEIRQHPDYLANPLFAANLENAKNGKPFQSEATVLAWAAEAKRLAKQYGYTEPSNNYLADGLRSGLSLGEVEHRIQVQNKVKELGAGVRWVYENELGIDISDQDLFEIFDKEKDTKAFDDAYRNASYRGRPVALGLGVRNQAEADAFMALGIDPEAAFAKYEGLAQNASRFERLGAIESLFTQGLPEDFNPDFSTTENSTLVRALLFNDQSALGELQSVMGRELARHNQGQSTAQGLLSGAQKQLALG